MLTYSLSAFNRFTHFHRLTWVKPEALTLGQENCFNIIHFKWTGYSVYPSFALLEENVNHSRQQK